MRVFLIILLATLSHVALGRWLASSWWMPDLTLLSIVVTMIRLPGAPMGPAVFGGLAAMCLSAEHHVLAGLAYLSVGAAVKWLAGWWEMTQAPVQRVVVGLAEGMLLIMLLPTIPVTWGVLVLCGARIAVTVLCFPFVRPCIDWALGRPEQVRE